MLERTKGVVLRYLKYNDTSMIVDIYTLSRGSLSFVVKMPRSRKSAVRTVLFRPLNVLEIDFDFRQNLNLQHIKEMRLAVSFSSLPYEPMKQTLALFLSEFLYHTLKHEDKNESLFYYLCNSLEFLDQARGHLANFHLVFLIRMTRFLGFWPNVGTVSPKMVFDLRDAVMSTVLPPHGMYLEANEAAMIPLLLRMDYNTMHLFKLNRVQRGRILDVLITYYRTHVPEYPELKSLDVLREVFSS